MNKQKLFLLILTLTLSLALVSVAYAQTGGDYDLSWWTVDGGGEAVTGGSFTLNGTIGQADAGQALTGGDYTLTGGFWLGGAGSSSSSGHKIYLPLVLK